MLNKLIALLLAAALTGPAAAATCRADRDCDDGLYCNGIELCRPATRGADVRGCVAAARPACAIGQVCNEGTDRCEASCPHERDADRDGRISMACGGDDCDDHNPNRFPGNPEICDEAGRDEDCDETTIGNRDSDGDGYVDSRCWNDLNQFPWIRHR